MGTNFFTNEKENTLLEKIEGVFKYKKVHFFDALVGYFRASGYFRIRKFIQQTPKIRILVGINIDKLTYQANQQGLLFNPNAEQSQEEFLNDIKRTSKREVKRERFKFSMCNIKIGEMVRFEPTGVWVKVASDDTIEYQDRIYKLSPFVGTFMPEEKRNTSGAYQGAKFFSYNGKILDDIRKENE